MARLIGSKHTLCRRLGEKICDCAKCPVARRSYPKGQHGPDKTRRKISGYGKQLLEKQKAKRIYGILERQFANYVQKASEKTGDTSKILLQYLESRLDNVVYRAGFSATHAAARQLVNHGHVTVNGRKVDIASAAIRVGDIIALRAQSQDKKIFTGLSEKLSKMDHPGWLSVDAQKTSIKVLNMPSVENPQFDAKAVIESYSR